jgi:hypothetical protein
MFAPHQEASDTTVDWLVESGIDSKRIKHSKGTYNPVHILVPVLMGK